MDLSHYKFPFIIFSFAFLLAPLGATQTIEPRLITVTGEGEVSVISDQVVLRLGVEAQGMKMERAKKDNDAISSKLLKMLKKSGISTKDIQVGYIDIRPQYDHFKGRRSLTGFLVRKDYVITIKDIKKVSDIIGGALDVGVENIGGLQYESSEFKKHQEKAREVALLNAKEKAEAMAGVLNQKIKRTHAISENPTFGHPIRMRAKAEALSFAASDDTFEPGQLKIKTQVTVSFELE
jgi:hypothetical protein